MMPPCIRRLKLNQRRVPAGVTDVTWHLALGSPESDTIEAHRASCLDESNDSTVSPLYATSIETTSTTMDGGEGGRGEGVGSTGLGNALTSLTCHLVDEDPLEKSVGVRSELLHPSRSRHRLPPALPAGMMENPLFPPFLGTYFISQDSKPLELSFTERDEQSLLYESLEEERRVEDGLTV
ncbi:MAG: hypothetical protein GY872_12820 [Roseibacillus sp.]|nr:hypothetical protein [Roseibacillus sp.]